MNLYGDPRDGDLRAVDSPYGPALVMEKTSGRWKLKRRPSFRTPNPTYAFDTAAMDGMRIYVKSTFDEDFTATTTWL